jgi:uncharacterized repeat protein (TIGR01451 family)
VQGRRGVTKLAAPQVQRFESTHRRRNGRWFRRLLTAALALALVAPLDLPWLGPDSLPAAVADEESGTEQGPPDPWPAGADGDSFADWAPTVFIAQRQPTRLFRVEQYTDVNNQNQTTGLGKFVSIGVTPTVSYNAISYRTQDDFIYAIELGAKNLLKIGQRGLVVERTALPGLPNLDAGWNAGTFGEDEHQDTLFIRAAGAAMARMYAIDVDTAAVTPMILSRGVPNTADLVYKDGNIWTFFQDKNNVGQAFRIDLVPNSSGEHEVAVFPINYGFNGLTFGAQWMYGNGNVGLSENRTGGIFQYQILDSNSAAPTFVPVFARPLEGNSSSLNDGTSKNGPPVNLGIVKRAPSSVIAGSSFEFTLEVTNHSDSWSSGFVVTDRVPAGFTNVQTLTSGCNSLPIAGGETEIKCVGGMLAPGATYEIKIRAQLPAATASCVPNTASVLGNEQEVDPSDNESTVSVCPAQPGLKVTKALDVFPLDGAPRVGDTMRHTIEVKNVGDVDYTLESPAIVTDDLTDVLDDAVFLPETLVASSGVGSFSGVLPRFTWAGPLQIGESVTISYEVELEAGGDGRVRNVVFEGEGDTPACDPPISETLPNAETRTIDQATGVPCHETEYLLPRLTISKVADLDFLPLVAGDIEYTVVVKNHGPGRAASPGATMTDDISALGDAVTYVGSTTSGVTMDDGVLSWEGSLNAGAEQVITFTVHYDPEIEDLRTLTNTACVLERDVLPGADHCASATLQSMRTSQWKTVTSVDDPILEGSELTYTLHFANSGEIDVEVDAVDHLGDVLDDTDFMLESLVISTSTAETFTAVYDEVVAGDTSTARILVTGTLLAGETATVTYTVTVKPEAQRGNNIAENFLLPPGDEPPAECITTDTRPNCTSTQLPGSLIWQKLDERYEPLAGSEWSVTPVDAQGQPTGEPAVMVTDCIGASVTDCVGLRDQDPAPGGFSVVGLSYGFYTLHETASPAGFFLETAPLARPELAIAVLDLGEFLNFQQWVPEIPLTGGLGEDLYKVAGLLALVTTAALLFWRVRRRHV